MNFLLAISTTIGMTIIPFIVTDSLGLSLLCLGILEGTTEFMSNTFRLTNGILFDKIKNKNRIFIFSTGLALSSKLFLLLPSYGSLVISKIMERISNGSFASPRDALFVKQTSKKNGMALSLLSISRAAGCIIGPLIVSGCAFFVGPLKDNLNHIIFICFLLTLPVFLLSFTIRDKIEKVQDLNFNMERFRGILKSISPILFLAVLFFLARFNDGILMIYLKSKGYPEWFYLSYISIFNCAMLLVSPLMGCSIDRGHVRKVMYVTIGALAIFNACFYSIASINWLLAIIGIAAWGIQRTGAQIVFSSLIFQRVEKNNYGTAIGLFYIISGISTMMSSFIMGYIGQYNLSWIFMISGLLSMSTLLVSLGVPLVRKINNE